MDIRISTYGERLKKYYEGYGDKESVQKINEYISSADNLNEDAAFADIPRVQVAVKSAKARYLTCAKAIMNKRDMTDAERKLRFIEMDWALWYIRQLGVNVEKEERSMIKTLEEEIIRNGLDL